MEDHKINPVFPRRGRQLRVLFAACLAVLTVLSGCGGDPDASADQQTTEAPYAEQFTGYEVETPVGKICYPERWMDAVEVHQETVDGTYTAAFSGKLEDETVPLFTLYVGPAGKGFLMGTVDSQSVWMDIRAAEPAEDWSEAEASQISQMQECVNDVMYQLYSLKGFVKNQPET